MSEPTIGPNPEVIAEARKELADALEECLGRLYGAAVPVALMGPWAAWADAQPVGAEIRVGIDDLAETKDPVIGPIGRALIALATARQELEEEAAKPKPLLSLLK